MPMIIEICLEIISSSVFTAFFFSNEALNIIFAHFHNEE